MAVSFDPTAVATNLLPHFGNDVLRFGQHNTDTESRGSLNGASGALFGHEYYDYVIMATPMKINNSLIKDKTLEEVALFNRYS